MIFAFYFLVLHIIGTFLIQFLIHIFSFQSQFTEKKSIEKYDIPSSYQLLSEIGEGTAAMLDKKVK